MQIKDIKNANRQQLRIIQLRELEILKQLKEILNKHGLDFFIIGGTLIGAVRNNGFIPWDDDIDILMKRKDYELFYKNREEWLKNTPFVLDRSDNEHNQHLTGMTFKDTRTTFINKHSIAEKMQHSMSIDIDPLDYRPIGKVRRKLQIMYAMIFSLYNADRVPDHQGRFLRLLSYIPLALVSNNHLKYRIWKWAEKKMISFDDYRSGEVVELGVGIKPLFRYDDAKWFDESVPLKFEDMYLPAPIGYKQYLKATVGDYMKLPPKNKQIPKHKTYLVDTEIPFSSEIKERIIEKLNGKS